MRSWGGGGRGAGSTPERLGGPRATGAQAPVPQRRQSGARGLYSVAQGAGAKEIAGGTFKRPSPTPRPPERRAGLGWAPPPAPRQAPSPALGRRPAAGARGLRQLRALSWRSGRPWPEPGSSCRPVCLCRICRSPGEGTEGWDKAASATGSGAVT